MYLSRIYCYVTGCSPEKPRGVQLNRSARGQSVKRLEQSWGLATSLCKNLRYFTIYVYKIHTYGCICHTNVCSRWCCTASYYVRWQNQWYIIQCRTEINTISLRTSRFWYALLFCQTNQLSYWKHTLVLKWRQVKKWRPSWKVAAILKCGYNRCSHEEHF